MWRLGTTGLTLLTAFAMGAPVSCTTNAGAAPTAGAAGAEHAHEPPARPESFQRESHGVVLVVDASDVTLARTGGERPFFSYRAFESERFQSDLAALRTGEPPDETEGCTRRIVVTPLAWAGVLLSVRQTSQTSCPHEAHPAGESRFVTFTISDGRGGGGSGDAPGPKPRATAAAIPASLTDWVDDRALFAALRKDRLVRAALASSPPTTPPQGLAELLTALVDSPPVATDEHHCFAFPDDLLQRFSPSHLEHGKLAVRLSLPGAAVCRENLTEMGILLPMPRSLQGPLSDAGSGQNGFLKRNPPLLLAKREVVIELSAADGTPARGQLLR